MLSIESILIFLLFSFSWLIWLWNSALLFLFFLKILFDFPKILSVFFCNEIFKFSKFMRETRWQNFPFFYRNYMLWWEFKWRWSLSPLSFLLHIWHLTSLCLFNFLAGRGTLLAGRGTLFPAEISYFLLKLKSSIMTLYSTNTY